jgi:hypothetical protein
VLEHFFSHYISIVILCVFLIFIFCDHVLPFLFLSIIFFFLFSIFPSFTFYLYLSLPEKDKRESIYSLFLNEKLYYTYFHSLFIYFSYNSSFQFFNHCFSMKNYTIVFFYLFFFFFVRMVIFNYINFFILPFFSIYILFFI